MDNINQIGKYLRKSKDQVDYTLTRYSEIFSMVDRIRDSFDTNLPFHMEFKTKIEGNTILVDLNFNVK